LWNIFVAEHGELALHHGGQVSHHRFLSGGQIAGLS
jgi:hypothetical protein